MIYTFIKRESHPRFNQGNIRTLWVLSLPYVNFLWVHTSHPVISFLQYNKTQFDMDVEALPVQDHNYVRIPKKLFEQCCKLLCDHVFT